MSAEIRDTRDGSIYTGHRPESIAKRVWGRKAEIFYSRASDAPFGQAQIAKRLPDNPGTWSVCANVMIYTKD